MRAAVNHSVGQYPLDESLMEAAVTDLGLAIDLDSENLGYYFRRAMAYEFLDKHDLAIGDYTYILQIEPDSPAVQGSRGYSFLELGDYDAAIEDFTAELALDSDGMKNFELRGDAYKATEDYQRAIDDYLSAVAWYLEFRRQLFGDDYEAGKEATLIEIRTKIGVTYVKMSKLEEALAQYEDILKHDPADPWAKSRLEALSSELNQ